MAIRKVILTERELTNLIKKIVRETEETETIDFNFGNQYEEDLTPEEIIANWFEDEGLLDLPERKLDRIEDKVDQIESKSMMERYIREDKGMGRKRPSFSSRMMQGSGAVMTVAGLMGFIGNSMGWSEFETTQKLHELTEMLNTSNYAGPISVAMIAAGIGLALVGKNKAYRETGR